MKIEFDKVSDDYIYPIGAKAVREILQTVVPSEVVEKIRRIRFGCNHKTTQEGRIVARGKNYDIRVNFCPKNFQSFVLSEKQEWLECVQLFGGEINLENHVVFWPKRSARQYAIFILLHEVGHIIYWESHIIDSNRRKRGSPAEEKWCDHFAKSKALNLA